MGGAGRGEQVHDVLPDLRRDVDPAHDLDELADLEGVGDRLEVVEGVAGAVRAQQLHLGLDGGVAHGHPRGEAVALRLGQRVGAFHLDRVLRGDDHERGLQHVRGAVHRHLPLLHRLQQRRLGLGGGPVDLVADDEVGEHGAGLELELARLLVVDGHAGHVARQQVGRELDAPHGAVDGAGQRLGQHRLADSRDVLDQQVTLGEQDDEREPDDLGLALDHLLDVVADAPRGLLQVLEPCRAGGGAGATYHRGSSWVGGASASRRREA